MRCASRWCRPTIGVRSPSSATCARQALQIGANGSSLISHPGITGMTSSSNVTSAPLALTAALSTFLSTAAGVYAMPDASAA